MAKHYFDGDEHHEVIIRNRKSRNGKPLPDVVLLVPPADLETIGEVNELEELRRQSRGREQIDLAFQELALLAPGCTKKDFEGVSVNTTVAILTRMVELATGLDREVEEKKSPAKRKPRSSRSSRKGSG